MRPSKPNPKNKPKKTDAPDRAEQLIDRNELFEDSLDVMNFNGPLCHL